MRRQLESRYIFELFDFQKRIVQAPKRALTNKNELFGVSPAERLLLDMTGEAIVYNPWVLYPCDKFRRPILRPHPRVSRAEYYSSLNLPSP